MIFCRTGFPDGDQLWNMSTAKQTPNCCCQTVQPAWNYRETGMLCVAWGKQPPTHRVTHPSRVYYQLAHLPTACEKTCKLYSKILTWFRHGYYAVWVCRRVCLPGYFHTLFIGSTRPRCMCVDRPPLSTSVVLKKWKKDSPENLNVGDSRERVRYLGDEIVGLSQIINSVWGSLFTLSNLLGGFNTKLLYSQTTGSC